MELRIGQGYDVHPLRAGRRLVLGGVEIAHERGLEGHSDADVLLHAIMDAVLGAAGLGLAEGAVGVKATTNERLGALGREEGIAALAVALLMRE